MFVKIAMKCSLVGNYEESNKVEVEIDSIAKHTSESEIKTFSSKKPLLLTRPKEEHSNELEHVVKMVQRLSNNIVDLEKDKETSSLKNSSNLISRKEKKVEHFNHLCIILLF